MKKSHPLIILFVLALIVGLMIFTIVGLVGDKDVIRATYNIPEEVKLDYVWVHMWGKSARVYTDGRNEYIVGGFGPWRSIAMSGSGSPNF